MKLKTALLGFLIFTVGFSGTGTELAFARQQTKKASVESKNKKTTLQKQKKNASVKKLQKMRGVGSWYSRNSPGIKRKTASGELFDDSKNTCALWHYPFGTQVRVTNLKTGKSVVCRVNDRGPSRKLKRVIDMSRASFLKIGKLHEGLIQVSVTPL